MDMEKETEGKEPGGQEEYPAWIGWPIVAFGLLAICGVCLVFIEIVIPFFRK